MCFIYVMERGRREERERKADGKGERVLQEVKEADWEREENLGIGGRWGEGER